MFISKRLGADVMGRILRAELGGIVTGDVGRNGWTDRDEFRKTAWRGNRDGDGDGDGDGEQRSTYFTIII